MSARRTDLGAGSPATGGSGPTPSCARPAGAVEQPEERWPGGIGTVPGPYSAGQHLPGPPHEEGGGRVDAAVLDRPLERGHDPLVRPAGPGLLRSARRRPARPGRGPDSASVCVCTVRALRSPERGQLGCLGLSRSVSEDAAGSYPAGRPSPAAASGAAPVSTSTMCRSHRRASSARSPGPAPACRGQRRAAAGLAEISNRTLARSRASCDLYARLPSCTGRRTACRTARPRSGPRPSNRTRVTDPQHLAPRPLTGPRLLPHGRRCRVRAVSVVTSVTRLCRHSRW